jgi:hypothetical protein
VNQIQVGKEGGISALVELLKNGDRRARASAAGALFMVSNGNLKNQQKIAKVGGIRPLIEELTTGAEHGRAYALWALYALASSYAIRDLMVAEGVIVPLVDVLRNGDASAQAKAASVVWSLALVSKDAQVKIAAEGAIPLLIGLLQREDTWTKSNAAAALSSLVRNDANKKTFVQHGGIPHVVQGLRDDLKTTKMSAAASLSELAQNEEYARAIMKEGAIPLLVGFLKLMMQDSDDNNKIVRTDVTKALKYLAQSKDGRFDIILAGGIAPLIGLVQTKHAEEKLEAAKALTNLMMAATSADSMIASDPIVDLIMQILIGELQSTYSESKMEVMTALVQLTRVMSTIPFKTRMGETGVIPTLIKLVNTGFPREKSSAALLLSMMSDGVEANRQAILLFGGLGPLTDLLLRGELRSRIAAVTIVWRVAFSQPVRQAILTVLASVAATFIIRGVRNRRRLQKIRDQQKRKELEQSLLSSEAADLKRKKAPVQRGR